jgi:hypothetical protein
MLKKWEKPNLEMLEVKMTMWNLWGSEHDGAWTEHLSNEVGTPGHMAEAQMS